MEITKSGISNEGIRVMRAAIRVALMAVLLGWLMLWIMRPTSVYKQTWLPPLKTRTNATFIGSQGANLVLFTFPILFVSVLGCIYLHLGNKLNHSYTQSKGEAGPLTLRRRPVLVKGPLGIVSGTELAFLIMFIALLLWSLGTYLRVALAKITHHSAAAHGGKLWEARLADVGLRVGLVGNICLAFLFFPVARGSSVLALFGLTSEGSIKYHMWLGHMALVMFTVHGVCFIILWALTHQISEMISWSNTDVSNVAGEISLVCGLIMWLTTFPRIRRKMFELFFYTHYLYIPFIIFFILHVGIAFSYTMLPGFYLFVVDRYLRFLQSRNAVRLVSARVLPCETVELNFSKISGLRYTPTSIMFINVPSISRLQWHPFSITSSSNLEPEIVSVVIKSGGNWSKKLYHMFSSPSPVDRLEVSVEGPYGPASTDFLKHETLVMVSGGSGITPFISIIRDLIFMSATLKLKIPRILLVCMFKDSAGLTMLDLLLPVTGSPREASCLQLQIEAYVTREKECPSSEEIPKRIQPVLLKPNSSDVPISDILGPNSWLWLAMIISSSFIMFLILLGILTQYYIYPIDHNSDEIYSASKRASFDILFICICISVTASAASLWNKRKNAMGIMRVKTMEALGSEFEDAGRELESLPSQSFIQANTKVQYGERPDMRSMLAGCKGSSVGVLVSGPRKLRQEIATICSSGVTENLHFESISFSW